MWQCRVFGELQQALAPTALTMDGYAADNTRTHSDGPAARDQRALCRQGQPTMPARAGEHDARARRAYNGSSPSIIRKQARQNVY